MTLDQRIETVCRDAIAAQVFPGCQVAYVRGGEVTASSYGRLRYDQESPAVTDQTLYDVASVTKSIPTNSIILKLVEDGRLSLDDQVVRYLPELQNQYRDDILIRHLATYTVVLDIPGGLSGVATREPHQLLHTIFTAPLVAPPGEKFHYTNAPAIMLGLIAEKVLGQPMDKTAREMFFEPLEMRRTTFRPQLDAMQVAPSERLPGGDIVGQPHDEAARALRGNGMVAGDAGVFSTASDILKFTQMLLAKGTWDGREYFKPESVRAMHTNQIGALGQQVGLGWQMSQALVPEGVGSASLFGKTGFTGCAVVIDPEADAAFVYLANRNYPSRAKSPEAIRAFRHQLARLLLG
jgi:CubicO group peptidase (beta-lactamase class C family)